MPTPIDTINIAKVSQYLASYDVAKGGLFGASVTPMLPVILYTERKSLEWLYNIDPSNENLQNVANYVFGLCGSYGLTAQAIISGGGGSVTPGTPTITPSPYQFEVSSSSFIATGESTKTITSFIGFNLLFMRGGIVQSTVNLGGTYYSYDKTLGTFECFGAAEEGELFQLFAV